GPAEEGCHHHEEQLLRQHLCWHIHCSELHGTRTGGNAQRSCTCTCSGTCTCTGTGSRPRTCSR
ncbi:MAG: hypothetical protein UEM79_12340, partial [Gemmiger sp.]|uniref:hypothetical protein n=1 Tax=Gemmiger sp. TaxID=2049027 RepID=UPI002E770BC8